MGGVIKDLVDLSFSVDLIIILFFIYFRLHNAWSQVLHRPQRQDDSLVASTGEGGAAHWLAEGGICSGWTVLCQVSEKQNAMVTAIKCKLFISV